VSSPLGATYTIQIAATGASAGLPVTLTAQPSSISVAPTTVLLDGSQKATAYAFVPYGTSGVVIASAPGSTTASIHVQNNAIGLGGGLADAGPSFGPMGVTLQLSVKGVPGLAVTLAPLPSTLLVAPVTVTLDESGHSTADVLVPYGTEGTVLVSAPGATAGAIPVKSDPLTLCTPTFQGANDGGDISSTGEIYTVSVRALTSGTCDAGAEAGTSAPAGVALTLTTSQASNATGGGGSSGSSGASSSSTTTALTNQSGVAQTNMQIPWGPNLLLQATGGGGLSSATLSGLANPITIACMYWSLFNAGLYRVSAQVVVRNRPLSATTVSFAVLRAMGGGAGGSSGSSSAAASPQSVLTTDAGFATTFIPVQPDGGSLPINVEATVGTAAFPIIISSSSGDAGACR
jgi:hypothetical protein